MKDEDVFDIMDPLHICMLTWEEKKQSLATWCEAWSTHRLRTVQSSPIRLWIACMANNPVFQQAHRAFSTERAKLLSQNTTVDQYLPVP
ncbi:hypothetical protein DPMN_026401 [Dreissena polymorpha]|uniref:Uncharacterized protein n=1 Tax=Dreissena polymorpha TaxID=45954 RepID=A0A9D4RDG1_DREPO|nr:hypothetical protein DPMN_026401 [Dreissena polymorpha]